MRTHRYQITILGGLGELGREAFADFKIEYANGNTVLTGDLDQAALYNALNRTLAAWAGTGGADPAERGARLI